MAYSDVKTQFLGILNRRDITSSLVNTFMGYAIQRIQREIRVPSMERVTTLTTDGTATLTVPPDLLQFISVHVNDNDNGRTKLTRTDLGTILYWANIQGQPEYYHREAQYLYVAPYPPEDTSVFVHYYADAPSLVEDTDTNWMTEVAPMLLVYAALSYASDYFLDDRKTLFEQVYMQTAEQTQVQALWDEVENASIRPAFNMDD